MAAQEYNPSYMNPAPVDYANLPPRRSWFARPGRYWIGGFVIVGAGIALIATDSGLGSRQEICDACSACRSVRTLGILGTAFDWNKTIHKGVICECLEEHTGIACTHKWRGYSWTSGFKIACGDGGGALDARIHLDLPGIDRVLMKHLSGDPTFETRLRQNLRADDADDAFITELTSDCIAQIKTQAGTP